MNNTLLNKREAAKILGISTVTLDRLRKKGSLAYRKVGGQVRFMPEDIGRYLAAAEAGGVITRGQGL